MKHPVAVLQMVSSGNLHNNLESAARLIESAASQGARLVVLPENFAVLDGGPLRQFAEIQGASDSLLQNFLAEQAQSHGIILVGGTVPMLSRPVVDSSKQPSLLDDGRVRPACLVYDNHGQLLARYDKIHLFDVIVQDKQAQYSESKSFEPGDEVVTVATPLGHLGLSICYDLRFPELYRSLAEAGSEFITVPSAFTRTTGEAHWEALLRARAIENQCYILAANQGGVHNETRETYGHSMIVDPWGEILDCIEAGEGLAIAELDLDAVHRVRRDMPISAHRRL